MVKANVIFGMQEYLGVALTKCNVSSKIGNTPISVCILTTIFVTKIGNVISLMYFYYFSLEYPYMAQ